MTSKPLVGKIRGDSDPALTFLDEHERVRLKVNEALECRKAPPIAKGVGHGLMTSW